MAEAAVGQPAVAPPPPPAPAKPAGDQLPSAGQTVKSDTGRHYNLKRVLGEGGYGTVFEASDAESRQVV